MAGKKKLIIYVSVFAIVFAYIGFSPGIISTGSVVWAQTVHTAAGIIQWTNYYRVQNGLPALATNTKLTTAAGLRVDDMFEEQYFSHVSPTGKDLVYLLNQVNYKYRAAGENIFEDPGYLSDQALVQGWMNSPGHRANILSSTYQDIGVSVKEGTFEGNDVWLASEMFGLSSVAPYCGDGSCNATETCATCVTDCNQCSDTVPPDAPTGVAVI
jgi:hypothetical protein